MAAGEQTGWDYFVHPDGVRWAWCPPAKHSLPQGTLPALVAKEKESDSDSDEAEPPVRAARPPALSESRAAPAPEAP